MKLGFVGTGTISAAVIEGLCAGPAPFTITVSPRNAAVAADLSRRFANVRVAADNPAVLEASDIVFLAVRPQILWDVLSTMRFRPDHHVVSLIAAVSLADLRQATAPAATVTRAVPIPSVARRQGPTPLFPPDPVVRSLFDRLGTAIELDNEEAFHAFSAATAMMASYFRFVDATASWMVGNGVAPETAHAYVGQMMLGLAGNWTAHPERSFATLADEHQTRGGLNEQVLDFLTARGAFSDIAEALDAVKARLIAARA